MRLLRSLLLCVSLMLSTHAIGQQAISRDLPNGDTVYGDVSTCCDNTSMSVHFYYITHADGNGVGIDVWFYMERDGNLVAIEMWEGSNFIYWVIMNYETGQVITHEDLFPASPDAQSVGDNIGEFLPEIQGLGCPVGYECTSGLRAGAGTQTQ